MPPARVLETRIPIAGAALVAHDTVSVEWDQVDTNIAKALTFSVSIQIERVQLWITGPLPLQNGNITAESTVPKIPGIPGEIHGLEPLNMHGEIVDWDQAHAVVFTVQSSLAVFVPKNAIAAAVSGRYPQAGAVVAGLMTTLSSRILVNIGHAAIHVPIVRDPDTNWVTQIGSAFRPA